MPGGTNLRDPLDLGLKWLKKRPGRNKFILLITDGVETVLTNPKTLDQLQAEAKAANIPILVLAMGYAIPSLSRIFDHVYQAAEDGSNIPDKILELFKEAHEKRGGK